MKANKINIRLLANFGMLLFMFVYLLVIGKSILVPLTFGALFAFMLKPLCTWYDGRIKWQSLAILMAMTTALIPISAIVYFFSKQCMNVVSDMPSIEKKVNAGISKVYIFAKNTIGYTRAETDEFFSDKLPTMVSSSDFFGEGFSSSTGLITGFLLTFIYVFLFLLYRSTFKNFMIMQTRQDKRENTQGLLEKIQKVIQGYLQGLLMVIAIMGIMNSVGLWVIGIEHPFFWGFLAASLAIIPFIGTFIGGLLPFLYALATTDESWQPIAVVILFMVVQILEGNLITPKVVGSSVSVNPLATIIALLIGAQIWGIMGMILSLPLVAIFNEFLKLSDVWRPVSLLISDEIGINEHLFKQKWNKERFRLSNFFKSHD